MESIEDFKAMKIIISGGWGYGNLGDDAILLATLDLLQQAYEGAEIVALTYSPDPLVRDRCPNVRFARAAHSVLDWGSSESMFRRLDRHYGLLSRIQLKCREAIANSELAYRIRESDPKILYLQREIADADLFVMAGGGYFNEHWVSNVRAHLREVDLARAHGVPYALLGQTFGAFRNAALKQRIAGTMRGAQAIAVRDEFSHRDLAALQIDAALIPDIALTEVRICPFTPGDERPVGLILNNRSKHFLTRMASIFARFIADSGSRVPVDVIMSRRWQGDLRASVTVQHVLNQHRIENRLVLPSSVFDLESALARCRLVISENLHGLIVAARNQVPVVAVNDYPVGSPNHRKFDSFMSQVGSERFCIDRESEVGETLELLHERLASAETFHAFMPRFCQGVREDYLRFVRDLRHARAARPLPADTLAACA